VKTNLPHCRLFCWWVEGGVSPLIFNVGFMWKWMVGFTLQPLYLWGTIPWCPRNRRLGGPQSQFGCHGVEKNLLPLPGIEPLFLSCPTRSVVPSYCTFYFITEIIQKEFFFVTLACHLNCFCWPHLLVCLLLQSCLASDFCHDDIFC